ncbi:ADP-ribose glycohydrolase MACROD1 isoform X9 [Takifugu rubripes]|uniref:ADP-ribose glycohydrolase MACROD1 isoform X9 n=1 Tax=Takifugu rubripes TaxID=31033 RepID=UPI00114542C0|nr:ADP-ribose glycohydrolase MACROD1 isoform X9 [Takifugu rubripes]
MALQMAALFAYKSPLCTGPLPRITANFQGAGAKFKHILSPGSQHFVKKPPTSLRGHFNIAPRGETFSKSAAVCTSSQKSGSSICRGGRGILGKIALGLAAGVSTATLVQSLHTGTFSAMAIKVNLNSAEGNWKEIKEFLLSCSVKDRRQYYRTSGFVPLDDIPAWTPTTGPPEQVICKRNENLDQKISLYSGDITKLEIDAIVNAGSVSESHLAGKVRGTRVRRTPGVMAGTWKRERKSASWMKRDVRPWGGVIKEKQGGRHSLYLSLGLRCHGNMQVLAKGLRQRVCLIVLFKLSCLLTVSEVILQGALFNSMTK